MTLESQSILFEQTVQVEKRFSSVESFGQNRTIERQIQLKMSEFVDRVTNGQKESELLYLSTQQYETTGKDDANDPFQTPCRQLLSAQKIPKTLSWAGNLCLQSCNLWMGLSENGSSSGLHHDYHDNFYILLQGRKQFRMYSPDTALFMNTYGTIERIHFNGVISYKGSETRPDGLPVDDRLEGRCESDDSNDSDDEQEDVVLGKGFDYQSSDEDAGCVDFNENGDDDFDKIVKEDDNEESDQTDDNSDYVTEKARPNSFSRLNFDTIQDSRDFQKCKEVKVDLLPGHVLYLPAGFFHIVTSFSSSDGGDMTGQSEGSKIVTATDISSKLQPHLAINYWYHPPDQLDSFQNPYTRSDGF
jgi:hypothetical protein